MYQYRRDSFCSRIYDSFHQEAIKCAISVVLADKNFRTHILELSFELVRSFRINKLHKQLTEINELIAIGVPLLCLLNILLFVNGWIDKQYTPSTVCLR